MTRDKSTTYTLGVNRDWVQNWICFSRYLELILMHPLFSKTNKLILRHLNDLLNHVKSCIYPAFSKISNLMINLLGLSKFRIVNKEVWCKSPHPKRKIAIFWQLCLKQKMLKDIKNHFKMLIWFWKSIEYHLIHYKTLQLISCWNKM